MRLALLAVVALLFGFTGDARAGGNVDWSDYIDKDGSSKLPPSKTPVVADSSDDAAPPPAAKATKSARTSKAKTSKKSKAKARSKSKTKAKKKH
ncbi:MAG TPA: hypothetical protein VFV99_05050 [Kofleriaceae bacterium]|nr:hypothetical protein [Kofleriaceae bacterium]